MNREKGIIGIAITLIIIAIIGSTIWLAISTQDECQVVNPNVDAITGYGGVVATVDGYDFQYRASGAACSKNQTNAALESNSIRSWSH